ncbi:hypothetical protein L914_00098 [Phytophthora nicotianae]|uniref:Tubulin epsilon and delta complex protein 1 domain-containing protein n=2 Tax=Phytophthora nicotianae TaxID=4792 RepID=V9G337_PHYNI|nr:hypothetical protein F443_00108 [Phytophthora nicotianae P1569]ETM57015.1 hypothetical protein L914_00098 [Phytophthora nicotianae]
MRAATHTPRFGYLLRLGLESIGVRYVSIDLLRKAKKNQTTEREYWTLWRLLHDLVLVVLADFEVDSREVERLNDAEVLESSLLDTELHGIQMELVRFYLYEWGFVCTTFYSVPPRSSSQVLLLAVAWLLAFSRFFEKQGRYILERCTDTPQPRLPPFPNDVDIDTARIQKAALHAVSTALAPCEENLSMEGQTHQLHSAFGRLQGHLNELQAYTRYHDRLLARLKNLQNKSGGHQELIPAYVLDLLAGPTSRLSKQVQVLAQSVQMIEDEAQFYKWINSLVLSLNTSDSPDSKLSPITATDSIPHALRTQVQEVQTLFQAHADSIHKIEQGYKQEWKKWTSRQKSRSRLQQMETKVENFTHEVQTRELFDPQKLFFRSQRSWEDSNTSHVKNYTKQIHLATKEEVDRLQTQIASVIDEITREYCNLQLR